MLSKNLSWKMKDGRMKLEVGSWKMEVGQFQKLLRKGLLSIFFLFSMFYSLSSQGQCAMCRASLESEGNATKVEAVNDGIVYLMVIPYVLVGIVGYIIFRMYNKKKVEGLE